MPNQEQSRDANSRKDAGGDERPLARQDGPKRSDAGELGTPDAGPSDPDGKDIGFDPGDPSAKKVG